MTSPIEARVEALERQLDMLRKEMRAEIKAAAHELRDSDSFIMPFWRDGADHAGAHLFSRFARWLAVLVVGALGVWVLLMAGSSGAFKGLFQ